MTAKWLTFNADESMPMGFSVTIDPYDLADMLSSEQRLQLARALCWDEVLTAAALRLARDINESNAGSDDPTARKLFLDAVSAEYDRDLEKEHARLTNEVARLERQMRGLFAEYVEGPVNDLSTSSRFESDARSRRLDRFLKAKGGGDS